MKKTLIVVAVVAGLMAALLGGGLWYLLSDDASDTPSDDNLTRTLIVAAIKGATLGTWYLAKASDMPADKLLAEIIVMKGLGVAGEGFSPADLDAIAARTGHALPADLIAILRTPGAIKALGWNAAADIDTARGRHGSQLPAKFRIGERDWPGSNVKAESYAGAVHQIPARALERYIVLSDHSLLDVMLLYDPSPSPAHACCRVIETSAFKSQNHDAYRSLAEYLRWEWAMLKAK